MIWAAKVLERGMKLEGEVLVEGEKDPLSWNGGTKESRLVMLCRALSGGKEVAVETDV